MAKVLLTGFDPFGGESVNPAYQVAMRLHGRVINGVEVVSREVPTVFGKSGQVVSEAIREVRPQAVLCLGQAGGTAVIRVERLAANIDDSSGGDNEGNTASDRPIADDGPAAYWATIPTRKMVQAIREAGIPAVLSYSAGTYVCNHLFYATSHFVAANNLPIKVGFIHVPYLLEQAARKRGAAGMPEEIIARAIEVAISVIADELG